MLSELMTRRNELSARRSGAQRTYYAALGVGVLCVAILLAFAWNLKNSSLAPVLVVYAFSPFAILPMYRVKLQSLDEDLQELGFQIDLQQYAVSVSESRAEKILRLNNFQLRRYHDINLRQNTWVFSLGIFCILIGVMVLSATVYLVLYAAQTLDAKIITGALGAMGSLLTNFIAAIYLKMHASAVGNLSSFYSKLVDTNQTLFGNLVASRIEDEHLRDTTLSKLALFVAGSKEKDKKEDRKGRRKEEKKPSKPAQRAKETASAAEANESAGN